MRAGIKKKVRKLPLKERIATAQRAAITARAFYDIWWIYRGPTRATNLPAMNVCSEFFKFDTEAHWLAMMINIGVLHDPSDDANGIARLLDDAKKRTPKEKTLLDSVQKLLDDNSALISKIRRLRNKVVAHRDAHTRYRRLLKDSGLKYDDLRLLIDASISVVNKLASAMGATYRHPSPYVTGDTNRLLGALMSKDDRDEQREMA